ncbi:MAG: HIT domain-containing protein [Pirellulales bacterium]|nr:HIT domain-containing protein [Pirellulales bacterium]
MTDDPLWAPWRLSYILSNKQQPPPDGAELELLDGADSACFLCQAAVDDNLPARHIVDRGEHVVTVLNRYPYNNGHLLVAPRRHLARLDQLPPAAEIELARTITRMVGAIEQVLQPQGFNIGLNLGEAGGAGLPSHLHWHIVPRWNADTNFMPIVGQTNVIPQSLEALWGLLVEQLKQRG